MPRPPMNTPKRGFDDARKMSNKALKLKKSSTAMARKSTSGIKSSGRLLGGADVPGAEDMSNTTETVPVEENTFTPEEDKSAKDKPEANIVASSGPCCFCASQQTGSTGNKKVDDMIDYVHQNLQEAGKALATLSENFEHDSKLMFVNILGQIQQWSGIVQNKLDVCKNDIEALRKELIARVCEITDLKTKLAQCEAREKEAIAAQAQFEAAAAHARLEQEALQQQATPDQQATVPTVSVTQDTAKSEKSELVVGSPQQTEVQQTEVQQTEVQQTTDPKLQDIVVVDAAVQSSVKDKDNMRREMELEAEIARLRKENGRIIKDRAEYENAIQRALLRGVSCLNVEALRVLRCPPIPCCSPCVPCPATQEPIVPCKNTKDNSVPGSHRTCNVTQRNGSGKSAGHERGNCTVKRPCGSPCCSGGRSRKSATNNSMVFLLHQGDTANVCGSTETSMPRVCGSPIMKKIEIPPCPRFFKQ